MFSRDYFDTGRCVTLPVHCGRFRRRFTTKIPLAFFVFPILTTSPAHYSRLPRNASD